jgi:peptidoglycan-associated lipoprotein
LTQEGKTMRKTILSAALLVLAGCSSTSLDQAPVSDRTAGATPGGTPAQSAVAPVTAQQPAAAAVGPAGVGRVIYFDYDSSAIRPEFQALLDSHAKHLRANPTRRVVVEGHTDERGGREYNLALGQQRSEAIRRALGILGAAGAQIEAVSFGEEKPAAQGMDDSAWAKNRRAEISYR